MIINFKELGAGQGGMSSGDVQSIIESYNYVGATDFEEANEVISTALNDLNERVTPVTITTTINSGSTDEEVPSAKAVYEELGNIETLLSQI